MFYDIFENLCKKAGTTPARVRKDLGISQSTMASWKARSLTPKSETLQRLSDYFGVSLRELIGFDDTAIENIYDARDFTLYLLHKLSKGDVTDNDIHKLSDLSVRWSAPISMQLYECMAQLNEMGQQKMVGYAEDLAQIPKYQREQPPLPQQTSPSTSESDDTTPPPDAPETPSEDE